MYSKSLRGFKCMDSDLSSNGTWWIKWDRFGIYRTEQPEDVGV
jgi:hypothetical protein